MFEIEIDASGRATGAAFYDETGGANRFGFVAGTERLAKAFSVWLPIFWVNGGTLFDDKMKPVFADATGTDALAFLL